jgi:flavin reductase (DIM6/NTAB) family NADH-FMN oxidoreductase RutF
MKTEADLAYRRALGAFATGVTVISTARPDGLMSGLTVNSFASVSLNPRLVLWCLGNECERYDSFASAELWGMTFLAAEEQPLALRYARAATETIAAEEADYIHGAPVLKAGVAHLACRTYDRRIAGDHLIIMGEVMDYRVRPGDGLAFYRGRYAAAVDPWKE